MQNQMDRQSAIGGGWGLGVFLIVAGVVVLLARLLPFDIGTLGWPLFVILAGAAFMTIGLSGRSGAGFVVPGSMLTMVGLILAVQNAFGLWATWSYAWPLVFPFALGLGIALLGLQLRQAEQVRNGTRMAGTGVVMFLVFGAFFEGILHVSGYNFGQAGDLLIPIVLIACGVVLIVLRTATGRPGRTLPPSAPTPGEGGAA